MSATTFIRQGGDLKFVFDRDGEDISVVVWPLTEACLSVTLKLIPLINHHVKKSMPSQYILTDP